MNRGLCGCASCESFRSPILADVAPLTAAVRRSRPPFLTPTYSTPKESPVNEETTEPLATWEAELLLDAEAKKEGALVEATFGDDVIRGRVRVQSGEARVGSQTGATLIALVRRGWTVTVIEKAPVPLPELPTGVGFYRPAAWGVESPGLAYQRTNEALWRVIYGDGTSVPMTAEDVQKAGGEKGFVRLGATTPPSPAADLWSSILRSSRF